MKDLPSSFIREARVLLIVSVRQIIRHRIAGLRILSACIWTGMRLDHGGCSDHTIASHPVPITPSWQNDTTPLGDMWDKLRGSAT